MDLQQDLKGMMEQHAPLPQADEPVEQNDTPAEAEATADASQETVEETPPEEATAAVTAEPAEEEKSAEDSQLFAFKKGMLEERRKRQELELEIARIKGRLEATPTPTVEEDSSDEEFWGSPQEFIRQETEKNNQKLLRQMEEELWQRTATMSEYYASQKWDDYGELRDEFMELVQTPGNEHLAAEIRKVPDPASALYNYMKQLKQPKVDPDSLRQQLEQELREKLEAEFAEKYKTGGAKAARNSLAGAQSATPPKGPVASLRGAGDMLKTISRSDY